MSIQTTQERKMELDNEISEALEKRDGDKLRKLAENLDEDDAEHLLETARRWEKEDDAEWDYDRSIGN